MPDGYNLITLPLEFSLNRIQILPHGLFVAFSVTCHMGEVVSGVQEEPPLRSPTVWRLLQSWPSCRYPVTVKNTE